RSQRSCLFPYTTLFRSGFGLLPAPRPALGLPGADGAVGAGGLRGDRRQPGFLLEPLLRLAGLHAPAAGAPVDVAGRRLAGARLQDRKSTRLNSSHVKIS